jgi:hypothetical protein
VGASLSAAAAAIGFCSDDRYPGYGALHRRLALARSYRDYWKTAWLEGAAALHARHRSRIDAEAAAIGHDVAALRGTIDDKARLLNEIRDFVRSFENAANALLRLYRDTNLDHRSTRPPAYFENLWRLRVPDPLADATDDDVRRLYEAMRIGESAEELVAAAREHTREAYADFVRGCRAHGASDDPAALRCA